ncbi:MAG: urea transporter [Bacteroidota bacterium]
MNKIRNLFPGYLTSIANSYSQIFFSNSRIFALILIVVSFFDWVAGLSGLLAVSVTNTVAYVFGLNRNNIKAGYYGFNSLLVALSLGIYFQLNFEFLIILIFASLFTLFITIAFEGVVGKYGLPYLTIPFLIACWMLTLATRQYSHLDVSERGIYMMNEMYKLGGYRLLNIYTWLDQIKLPASVIMYFRSLGAIFFQYSVLAGVLITVGLIIYSRIAFLLSLLGFFSAYFFYRIIGANISELSNHFIGFNFILTAIAIGGFFIVSSRYSFLWVLLMTPLIVITITSMNAVLAVWQLPIYSLPFNLIVLLFLYALKFRERFHHKPELVYMQQGTPERNIYFQSNNRIRFKNTFYLPFSLPFIGEWKVTQGYNGEFTHKDDWRHALDFEVYDEKGMAFKIPGANLEDFYCFNKPVLAPYSGTVEEIEDDIEDNKVGETNSAKNWGNTIIIRHADGLYSKLSHLKKNTFKVAKGDYVKKGDVIAYCGNSGNSPKPHIHFQLQATPYIGSKTIEYPIGNYLLNTKGRFELKQFEKPNKDDKVTAFERNRVLANAFNFIPGRKLRFKVEVNGQPHQDAVWEIEKDIYNQLFISCSKTNSKIYFYTDDVQMYFTSFTGNQKSVLFQFYLSAYKVMFGFYQDMEVKDVFPIHIIRQPWLIFIQDFFASFYIFLKPEYTLNYVSKTDDLNLSQIELAGSYQLKVFGKLFNHSEFKMSINNDGIQQIRIENAGLNKTVTLTKI